MSIPILYDYRPFITPKRAVFSIDTNKYGLEGWILKPEEYSIIGETDDTYVTRLLRTCHGEWVGETVVQHKYVLPIGIHKSRLVRWTEGQLTIDF